MIDDTPERTVELRRRNAAARQRAWAAKNQMYLRNKQLGKLLGITHGDYERMLAAQGGVCAICGSDDPGAKNRKFFFVDHDHATGAVRQVLCNNCNLGLGRFKDRPDLLRRAAEYLDKHRVEAMAKGA